MYQARQLTATVILLGTVLLICPVASSFSELAVFSAVYGLVYGATVAVHITVLAEIVGVNRFGSALGFFMLIRSSGGLLGPPIAGKLEDALIVNCKYVECVLRVSAFPCDLLQHANWLEINKKLHRVDSLSAC